MGAIKRMQMYDISQMVVMDHKGCVTGIIDESDILLAVSQDQAAFAKGVTEVMTRRLETITPDHPVEDLMRGCAVQLSPFSRLNNSSASAALPT